MQNVVKNQLGTWDLPTQIANRTYPEDGLISMHRAIQKHGPAMLQYAQDVGRGNIEFKVRDYNRFLAFLASALYCWPQGRSRALERLTYAEFMKAYTNGEMPTSRLFNTSWGYGRQVVTFAGGILNRVLHVYITILRKKCQEFREELNICGYRRGFGKLHDRSFDHIILLL